MSEDKKKSSPKPSESGKREFPGIGEAATSAPIPIYQAAPVKKEPPKQAKPKSDK